MSISILYIIVVYIVFNFYRNDEITIEVKSMVVYVYPVSRHKAAWLWAAQVTLPRAGAGQSSDEVTGDSAEAALTLFCHIFIFLSV